MDLCSAHVLFARNLGLLSRGTSCMRQKTCAQYTGSKQEVEVNMARRSTAPHFWSEEETNFFISVVKTMNIMSFVDGRKYRDSEIYKKVTEKLLRLKVVRRLRPDANRASPFTPGYCHLITNSMYTGVTLSAHACKRVIFRMFQKPE